jgi:hypothetical protein
MILGWLGGYVLTCITISIDVLGIISCTLDDLGIKALCYFWSRPFALNEGQSVMKEGDHNKEDNITVMLSKLKR